MTKREATFKDLAGNEVLRASSPLSEAAINTEKRGKPRPDLLPAKVVYAFIDLAISVKPHHATAAEILRTIYTQPKYALSLIAWWIGVERFGPEARPEQVVAYALHCAGEAMGYGYRKHGNCTWNVSGTEQARRSTHHASVARHVLEYFVDNYATEEGSGYPVLWHALAQLFIMEDCPDA